MSTVQMAADEHAQAGAGSASGLLVELQTHLPEDHRVVLADGALLLVAEDLIQVDLAQRHESRSSLPWGMGKGLVVTRHEALPQIVIGVLERPDAGQPQLVDQAALHRAVHPLAAPPGLG